MSKFLFTAEDRNENKLVHIAFGELPLHPSFLEEWEKIISTSKASAECLMSCLTHTAHPVLSQHPFPKSSGTAAGPQLTCNQPDREAQPSHVVELQHEIDVEEDAQGWSQWYQG